MTKAYLESFMTPGQLAGTETIEPAFETALADTAVTELILPETGRLLSSGSWIDLSARKGLTIDFNGSTIFKTGTGTATLFLDRFNDLGYGAGVQDLIIKNGILEGSFADNRPMQLLGSNHGQHIYVHDFDFIACAVQGYHVFELDGVDDFLLEDVNFNGYKPNGTSAPRTEAVNLDISQVGAGATVAPYGDGLATRNVTLRRVNFNPWTDPVTGTSYPSPIPLGSHSSREGAIFDNITVENVNVVDPPVDTMGGTSDLDVDNPYHRGLFHLPSARNVNIQATVHCSDNAGTIRVVQIQSASTGVLASSDPNDTAVHGTFTTPNVAESITVDITVSGMNGVEAFPNPLVYIDGVTNGNARAVRINVDTDGVDNAVYLRKVSNVTVNGRMTNVADPVILNGVTEFTVGPARVRSSVDRPAVITYLGVNSNGTIRDIDRAGYRSLWQGAPTSNVRVIDAVLNAISEAAPPILIELWDKSFGWLGPVGSPLSVSATKRRNAASDCTFTVTASHPRIADLMTSGTRAVVTYQPPGIDPIRLISGRLQTKAGENPAREATRTFTVRDDWTILQTTTGWPTPTAAIGDQDAILKYTKTGPAETVVLDLLQKNYVTRLGQPLVLPTSLGRGSSISTHFRMDYLADQLFPAADTAGIIVEIGQVDDHREVTIRTPDTYPFTLTEGAGVVVNGSFSMDEITATRIIVGVAPVDDGTGQTARIFRQFINTAAETALGEPLEMYVDGTSIALTDDVTAEAQKLADENFTTNGPKVNLDISLIETGAFRYGQAFHVGDIVSVQLTNSPVFTDYVREVQIDWTPDQGLIVTPKVGKWEESSETKLINEVAQMGKALRSLQRR